MVQVWQFTITFKSNLTAVQKFKKIDKLKDVFSRFINFDLNPESELMFSIEYHKLKYGHNAGHNNLTVPHLHGMLTLNRLSQFASETILQYLQKYYGRTQFFICESDSENEGWLEYCRKDVPANNERHFPFEHWRQYTLSNVPLNNIHEYMEIIEDCI